jgi:DNA-binding MarR family transcriptional regulator
VSGALNLVSLPASQEDDGTGELRERVRAGLAELRQQHREILEFYYLEGLSCQEVATRTGLAVGTVKRRLHESRQRFRKEWRKMARAQHGDHIGRHLTIWTGGDAEAYGRSLMSNLLPQSIALAINKHALTAEQIGEKVGVDPTYVVDLLPRMVDLDFVARRKDRYLLNFLALERDEYQQLLQQAQAMGQEMAGQFAAIIPSARTLFERTQVAGRGWTWDQVQWIFVAGLLYSWGLYFTAPEITSPDLTDPLSMRSDGRRYTIMGLERVDEPQTRLVRCKLRYHTTFQMGCGTGWIWWEGRTPPYLEGLPEGEARVMLNLADGPKTLREATANDAPREALAKLVESGLARRRKVRFETIFPIFGPTDMDELQPRIGDLLAPAVARAFVAEAMRFDGLLERQGHGRLSGQFRFLRHVLAMQDARGWTMHYLVQRGELPPLPEAPPSAWGCFGWVNGKLGIRHGSG